MIRLCFLYMFLNSILFFSCNKEKLDDFYWGNVNVLKNNVMWTTKIRAAQNKPYLIGISIFMDGYKSDNYLTDGLVFYKMPFKVDSFPISITESRDNDGLIGANYATITDGGGVSGASYELVLNDTIPDYIEITSIKGNEITGIFSVSFKLKDRNGDLNAPEFVSFTDGTFLTRLP